MFYMWYKYIIRIYEVKNKMNNYETIFYFLMGATAVYTLKLMYDAIELIARISGSY